MIRRHWLLALSLLALPILLSAQAPQAPAQTPAPSRRGGAATAPGAPATPPAPLKISTDLTGWKPMFDGVSLKGWDGPPLWHVEDGAIVVQSSAEPPTG